MKKMCLFAGLMVSVGLSVSVVLAQSPNDDAEGCKDYPLFNRMPNFHIVDCETVEFDGRNFPVGPPMEEQRPKQIEVEGALTYIRYNLNEGAKQASGRQIMRNFENATKAAGGTVQGTYPEWCTSYADYDPRLGNSCTFWGVSMKFTAGEREIWAYMQVVDETGYALQIIEREAMQQAIVIDAAALQQGLEAMGHVAVYDILFDTGKSEIKPESEAALKEIASLLQQSPALKLHVVGHTDNTGDLAANMNLSQARAAAVVTALTARHGVAAGRLAAFGAGPYAPVASNSTEEGKAKNRRVELVEQ